MASGLTTAPFRESAGNSALTETVCACCLRMSEAAFLQTYFKQGMSLFDLEEPGRRIRLGGYCAEARLPRPDPACLKQKWIALTKTFQFVFVCANFRAVQKIHKWNNYRCVCPYRQYSRKLLSQQTQVRGWMSKEGCLLLEMRCTCAINVCSAHIHTCLGKAVVHRHGEIRSKDGCCTITPACSRGTTSYM